MNVAYVCMYVPRMCLIHKAVRSYGRFRFKGFASKYSIVAVMRKKQKPNQELSTPAARCSCQYLIQYLTRRETLNKTSMELW